jgi:DNA polymerase III sliding clamp (beta) subunit (PCNA family)
MKFDTIKDIFAEAVNAAGAAVSPRDPIEAFRCIRLAAVSADQLQVAGVSREAAIFMTVAAHLREQGEALAIPADKLASVVDGFPENDVLRFDLQPRGRMRVTGAGQQAILPCAAWGLLDVPKAPETFLGTLQPGAAGIFRGIYAADADGELAALRLDVKDGRLSIFGTNRYRWMSACAAVERSQNSFTWNLPRKASQVLAKLYKDQQIEVYGDGRNIAFKGPVSTLVCGGLASAIPDAVLAQARAAGPATSITVPTADLRKKLKIAKGIAAPRVWVKLGIEADTLTVTSKCEDGGDYDGEIHGENVQGQPRKVFVSAEYLEDALAQVATDGVVLGIGDPKWPIVSVKPQFGDAQETHNIMPMQPPGAEL